MAPHGNAGEALRTLMEPRRLEILRLIWEQELSVTEIAHRLPVSVAAVSQHLSKLRAAGLVERTAEGRKRFYRPRRDALHALGPMVERLWTSESAVCAAPAPIERERERPSPPAEREQRAAGTRSATPTPASVRPPRQTGPSSPQVDEMLRWYRQGLRARLVALEAARASLLAGTAGSPDSVRRLARSLRGAAIAQRFGDVAEEARKLASAGDDEIAAQVERVIGAVRQASVEDDPKLVRILVVEDNPVEATLHRAAVAGPNREVLMAASVDEARRALEQAPIDLILLDLTLPGADGRDLLLELGARPRTASIPVILLTGRMDAQSRTEAVALGADVYYTKPADKGTLAASAAMLLERYAEARQVGRRDPLTGLRNRAVFLDEVRQLAASTSRSGVELTLAVLDVERLAAINDRYGSDAGDAVMGLMANSLRSTVREADLIGRWGGSKFAVLFVEADESGAATALSRLQGVTEAASIEVGDGTELKALWHAGVAEVGGSTDLDGIVARATRRLQMARKGRTGRVAASDAAAALGTRTILVIEDDQILADLIDHRLSREGFEVVHFGDGAEALEQLTRVDASAVILDSTLPGAEGFEVLRRLRAASAFAGVPVVMLTFGSQHDTARAFKLGASDAMAKPFSVDELVARVSRLVRELEGDSEA